jgi:hypothetical protein
MEEPIYNEAELEAYHAGRAAKKAGKDYFDTPYPYDPRGSNPKKWAWEQGWLDEESGTSLEETLDAIRIGMSV